MDNKIARNLSLKQFRAFVSVAKCGSFSAAALKLATSQPALSLSIQQFEEIVGVPLLSRTTRSVSPTSHGQEFLPKAEKILADVESAILSTRKGAEKTEKTCQRRGTAICCHSGPAAGHAQLCRTGA